MAARAGALAGAVLLAVLPGRAAEPVRGAAEAIDGDSLEVAGYEVRLWGIDAPEFDRRCAGQPLGKRAHQVLAGLVAGEKVACDVRYTDIHTRLVATCTAGGTSLNRALLRRGWARPWGELPKDGPYAAAAAQAQSAGRGYHRWACRIP